MSRSARPTGHARFALAVFACAAVFASGPASGGAQTAETSVDDAARRPAHWPDYFGFGTPASEERVARWDIDVKPDGEGLPPGSGTVDDGARVYRSTCRRCHGATGREGPDDRLVSTDAWEQWPAGRSVGNYWPYATTLFDYIVKAMPARRPGTLTADETYAVIAYILHLNGIIDEDAVMDAGSLPAVRMPARDRFVPDNRTGGPVIR